MPPKKTPILAAFTVSEVYCSTESHYLSNDVTVHETYHDALLQFYKCISGNISSSRSSKYYDKLLYERPILPVKELSKLSDKDILAETVELSKEIWYDKDWGSVDFDGQSIVVHRMNGFYSVTITSVIKGKSPNKCRIPRKLSPVR